MNRFISIFFLSTALVSLTVNIGHAMEPEDKGSARPVSPKFEFEREDQAPAKRLLTDREIQDVHELFAPLTNLLRGFYVKNEYDALVNACLQVGISFPKDLNSSFDAFYNVGTNSRGLIVRLEALIPDFLRTAQTSRYLAQGDTVPQWALDIANKMKGYDLPKDSVYQNNKTQFMAALSTPSSEGLSLLTKMRATMAYHRVLFEDHPEISKAPEVLRAFGSLQEKLNVMHESMKDNGLRRAFEIFESKLPALMPMLRYEEGYASQNPILQSSSADVRISDAGAEAIEGPYNRILPWLTELGSLVKKLGETHNSSENPYRRARLFSAETADVVREAAEPQAEGKPTGRLAQNIESVEKVLKEAKNLWAQVALAARREAIERIPHPKRTYFMSKAQEQANTVFQNNLPRTLELLTQLTDQLNKLETGTTERLEGQATITHTTLRSKDFGLKIKYLNDYREILDALVKLKDEKYPAMFASFKESEPHLRAAALYTPDYVLEKNAEVQGKGLTRSRSSADLSGNGTSLQGEPDAQPQSGRPRTSSDTIAQIPSYQGISSATPDALSSVIKPGQVKKMMGRLKRDQAGQRLQRQQGRTFSPAMIRKFEKPQQ